MQTARFKIGLQLPEVEYVASWSEHVEMARLAEDIGVDSLWLGDHLLYNDTRGDLRGPWECLSMLSALAAITTRVELGPLVLATAFRNPALTAKMAETIDEISDGRLILGLGAGWNETEFTAFGFPFDQRFSRFAESFEIIRRLIRDGEADFDGEFARARQARIIPRGPRPGRIPLMIGSTGERMLRHTLPHVDAWNIWYTDYGNSVDGLRPHLKRLDRLCTDAGRDPGEIERTAAVLVTAPGGTGRQRASVRSVSVGISGTPADVARQLHGFSNAGLAHIQIVLDPITPAAIEWLGSVIPAVRNLERERATG